MNLMVFSGLKAVIRRNPSPLRQFLNLPPIAIFNYARYKAFQVNAFAIALPPFSAICIVDFIASGPSLPNLKNIIISYQAFFPWPKLLAYGARRRQYFFRFSHFLPLLLFWPIFRLG